MDVRVPASLELGEKHDVLYLPKQTDSGFEVTLECNDVVVSPAADGWHAGVWDVTVWEPETHERSLREFITSVLTDAELAVFYSNNKPYKWVRHYQFDGNRVLDRTGLLLFNWFGQRSKRCFSNGDSTLP